MEKKETVTLTQTQINQSINAFEEANRVLNNPFITPENISNLQEEIRAAWKTLSQAQHQQRKIPCDICNGEMTNKYVQKTNSHICFDCLDGDNSPLDAFVEEYNAKLDKKYKK